MNKPINYPLAKLLKEKGFNELCNSYIDDNGISHPSYGKNSFSEIRTYIPTIAEVVMWLYEKYGIWIVSFPTDEGWTFDIFIKTDCVKSESFINFPTEAYFAAIEYCLKNLI